MTWDDFQVKYKGTGGMEGAEKAYKLYKSGRLDISGALWGNIKDADGPTAAQIEYSRKQNAWVKQQMANDPGVQSLIQESQKKQQQIDNYLRQKQGSNLQSIQAQGGVQVPQQQIPQSFQQQVEWPSYNIMDALPK